MALFARKSLDMLSGSLWDKIILFAVPLAFTGVLQQLFNAADVAVLGRFVSNEAMAAVGTDVPVIGTVVSLAMGLALGANVIVARFIGMKDEAAANRGVHTAFALALILGLVIATLGEIFCSEIMALLSVPDSVVEHASNYLRVFLLGLPFITVYNFLAAVFRSKGDTNTPLMALIVATVFNIAGNLFFVVVIPMGAAALANGLAAGILFVKQLKMPGVLHLEFSRLLQFDKPTLNAMVRIGLPAGIQGMVFSLSNMIIQEAINNLGADAMAGSVAAFTIEINVYCFINAFGLAATTFVSQNYGAGNLARCRRATWVSMWINFAATALLIVVVIAFAHRMLSFFSDSEAVIALGIVRIWYVVLPELISVVMETVSDAMRGYGYSLPPAMVTLVCICSIRILWVYTVFPASPTFDTLMMVYPVSWLVTMTLLVVLYFRHQKTLETRMNRRHTHAD